MTIDGAELEPLGTGGSFVGQGRGGQKIVAKRLPGGCMQGERLHPRIRERLTRVRSVAHPRLANFHGVQRGADGAAYLVWDFVEGRSLAEVMAGGLADADALMLARELILAAELLCNWGVVHGAIHANNVIVDRAGAVWLTHVSPLVQGECVVDVAATAGVLGQLLPARQELFRADGEMDPFEGFRRLSAKLAGVGDGRVSAVQMRGSRWISVAGAGAVLVAGLIVTYALWRLGMRAT